MGACRAWHVTITHPCDNLVQSCLTWLSSLSSCSVPQTLLFLADFLVGVMCYASLSSKGRGSLSKGPGAILSLVRVPGVARDFCSRVNFKCRLSYGVRTAPFIVSAIARIIICAHVKSPKRWHLDTQKHWRGLMVMVVLMIMQWEWWQCGWW